MSSLIEAPFHMAAMSYPGRGHINAMMNFCRLLSSHTNFLISFVVTEEWLSILSSDPSPPPNIKYRTIPNCIPSERGRAADMNGFIQAILTDMEEPFERLLDELDPPAKAIIGDTFLSWVVKVGNKRCVPVCSLFPMAGHMFSVLNNYDLLPVPKATANGGVPTPDILAECNDHSLEQYIPGLDPLKSSDLNTVYTVKPIDKILQAFSWIKKAQCLIFTSFYELESGLFDSLQTQLPCDVYPIGPCIPYFSLEKEEIKTNQDHYLTWLDSKPKQSVLYVSLGSFLSVSSAQADEIANGLVSSEFNFLWVVRDSSSRIQEMVGESGLIVSWCEQLKVMCHPSIGGFLTHCGWNSTLEALYAGVPMLTLPIFWDQDVDSRLIVDKWNVGLSLKEKMGTDGIVGREEIEKNVKKLMDLDGNVSAKLRIESSKLKEMASKAMEMNGSSNNNLHSFVQGLLSLK